MGPEKFLQLRQERFHILEVAINRCKPKICDLIDRQKPLHEHVPDLGGRNLPIRSIGKAHLDGVHDLSQLRHGNRPLFTRLQKPFEHLLAIEFLPPPTSFDDHVGDFVTSLVSGEASLAFETLAAPADDVAVFGLAGIDDAVLTMAAKRAGHLDLGATLGFGACTSTSIFIDMAQATPVDPFTEGESQPHRDDRYKCDDPKY